VHFTQLGFSRRPKRFPISTIIGLSQRQREIEISHENDTWNRKREKMKKGRLLDVTSRISSPSVPSYISSSFLLSSSYTRGVSSWISVNGAWQLQGPVRQVGATECEHLAILMRSCFLRDPPRWDAIRSPCCAFPFHLRKITDDCV